MLRKLVLCATGSRNAITMALNVQEWQRAIDPEYIPQHLRVTTRAIQEEPTDGPQLRE